MTQYGSFLYFGVTLYFVIPLLAAGLLFKNGARSAPFWILAPGLFMLVVQYWRMDKGHGQPQELWIVPGYAALQWVIARLYLGASRGGRRAGPYALALAGGLAPLVCVKLPWSALSGVSGWVGFAGISYVTFRSLDVIIGIRDGLITALPPVRYAAFLLFFPTISSGPIDRWQRFVKDFERRRGRAEFLDDLDGAVQRLFRGFLYKFILALLIDRYWMTPAAGNHGWLGYASYMYAYSLYLFFDFAGYSAFAVAFSYLLGVHSPENFNRPFLARNIREFWDRWHISLSWWFRDHVYMRFVLAATKGRWFKSRYAASHLGFFLTMLLMGLWHGLQLHYLVYGLYHGSLLVGHDIFARWNKPRQRFTGRASRLAAIFITFNVICFGLMIFSGHMF